MQNASREELMRILLILIAVLPIFAQWKVGQWEVVEISMTATRATANPYVDGLPDGGRPMVRVSFTGQSGPAAGMRHEISGFWDGGTTWKVRFAPPTPGAWSYKSASADPRLDGISGTIQCSAWSESDKQANPVRRGFIHVAKAGPRPGRHFAYADGTPFLWIADTWWAWHKKGILFSSFQKLADDRAAKGFTIGQIFFAGNYSLLDETQDHPDLEQIRKVEQFIAYANGKGITVWIHPWWSGKGMNEKIGPEKIRRWWRYTIQRLGAYNVIWVLAGEYNLYDYGGLGLDFWKRLGAMVREEDPYRRILGVHPTCPAWEGGADAPQWSTGEVIHQEPWLDYNQSQTAHTKWRNELIPLVVSADYARVPPKPVVVTEPWYEFLRGDPAPEDTRFGAWTAILSGAAGHTYGGGQTWWAHLPEAPSSQGPWPLEKSFDKSTLDYPGAVSIGYLARFMKSIRWWELEPHPELVSEYAAKYCAAVPGREYILYVRWGGALKLDLRPSSASDVFHYKWIDLSEEKTKKEGTVVGGGLREFHAPEDEPGYLKYKDWLLHVGRQ
jgi:hypothetical protein